MHILGMHISADFQFRKQILLQHSTSLFLKTLYFFRSTSIINSNKIMLQIEVTDYYHWFMM